MQRQPESEDDEHEVNDPKAHHGLLLTPTFEFEVMVKGSHLKYTTTESVSGSDLCDDGESLDIEHKSKEV